MSTNKVTMRLESSNLMLTGVSDEKWANDRAVIAQTEQWLDSKGGWSTTDKPLAKRSAHRLDLENS